MTGFSKGRHMFKDQVHDIGTPTPLGDRGRRERQLQDFLAATLDPLERRVFVLRYRDEIPLDAISRLLGVQRVADVEDTIVSARRKIARATVRFGVLGEYL